MAGTIDVAIFQRSYSQSESPDVHLLYARIALVIGLGMTLPYLKFFRLCAVEVFTSFAYAKEPENRP